MTTSDYMLQVKSKYPNTFIGFCAFINNLYPNDKTFISKLQNAPIDYALSFFIKYIEYRNVNFLEALCNTQVDNISDNHELLRMKTVTIILYRLEKLIRPVEGLPF